MKLCVFDGCNRGMVAHGLCWGHRTQRMRGKALAPIHARWTKAQIAELRELFADGMPIVAIARAVGRSLLATHVKRERLGLERPRLKRRDKLVRMELASARCACGLLLPCNCLSIYAIAASRAA